MLLSEISFCVFETSKRSVEFCFIEFWPKLRSEIILAIFTRIEPVSGVSDISSGSYDKVWIRKTTTIKVFSKRILIEILQKGRYLLWSERVDIFLDIIFYSSDYLILSSISDSENKSEFCSIFCSFFHYMKCLSDILREKILISEYLETDTFSLKFWKHLRELVDDETIDVIEFFWRSFFDISFCESPKTHVFYFFF